MAAEQLHPARARSGQHAGRAHSITLQVDVADRHDVAGGQPDLALDRPIVDSGAVGAAQIGQPPGPSRWTMTACSDEMNVSSSTMAL